VKYELSKLEEIILVSMMPENFNRQAQKAASLKKWQSEVSAEKERIQGQFLHELFNCENESRMQRYIYQHQEVLVKLVDNLYHYLLRGDAESLFHYPALKNYTSGYTAILDITEQFLFFIVHHFKKYCNPDLKITDRAMVENIGPIKTILKKLKSVFNKHSIEKTLNEIVCTPLEEYISGVQVISYRRIEFMSHYKEALNGILDQPNLSADEIYKFLIRTNLNSVDFVHFFTKTLKANTRRIDGIASLDAYYSKQLKDINQIHHVRVTAYDPNLPDIREQICDWLSEEIYYLERKQQFDNHLPVVKEQSTTSGKVYTRLSVGNLSLAIKLLLDTGVIKNKNTTELMRMVARNFRTEKSEHISEDSLRNKVYNIESSAVNGMKDVIVGLLNEVRKY